MHAAVGSVLRTHGRVLAGSTNAEGHQTYTKVFYANWACGCRLGARTRCDGGANIRSLRDLVSVYLVVGRLALLAKWKSWRLDNRWRKSTASQPQHHLRRSRSRKVLLLVLLHPAQAERATGTTPLDIAAGHELEFDTELFVYGWEVLEAIVVGEDAGAGHVDDELAGVPAVFVLELGAQHAEDEEGA